MNTLPEQTIHAPSDKYAALRRRLGLYYLGLISKKEVAFAFALWQFDDPPETNKPLIDNRKFFYDHYGEWYAHQVQY